MPRPRAPHFCFTNGETEDQREAVTCLGWHSSAGAQNRQGRAACGACSARLSWGRGRGQEWRDQVWERPAPVPPTPLPDRSLISPCASEPGADVSNLAPMRDLGQAGSMGGLPPSPGLGGPCRVTQVCAGKPRVGSALGRLGTQPLPGSVGAGVPRPQGSRGWGAEASGVTQCRRLGRGWRVTGSWERSSWTEPGLQDLGVRAALCEGVALEEVRMGPLGTAWGSPGLLTGCRRPQTSPAGPSC